MNTKTELVIKNIHTNSRKPGIIYASVYDGDELVCSATLDYCHARIKCMVRGEDVDVMKLYTEHS